MKNIKNALIGATLSVASVLGAGCSGDSGIAVTYEGAKASLRAGTRTDLFYEGERQHAEPNRQAPQPYFGDVKHNPTKRNNEQETQNSFNTAYNRAMK